MVTLLVSIISLSSVHGFLTLRQLLLLWRSRYTAQSSNPGPFVLVQHFLASNEERG